jgi:hypothetical protein
MRDVQNWNYYSVLGWDPPYQAMTNIAIKTFLHERHSPRVVTAAGQNLG